MNRWLMAENDSALGFLRMALVYRYYFWMEETEEHTKIIISLEIYIQAKLLQVWICIFYICIYLYIKFCIFKLLEAKRWIHLFKFPALIYLSSWPFKVNVILMRNSTRNIIHVTKYDNIRIPKAGIIFGFVYLSSNYVMRVAENVKRIHIHN